MLKAVCSQMASLKGQSYIMGKLLFVSVQENSHKPSRRASRPRCSCESHGENLASLSLDPGLNMAKQSCSKQHPLPAWKGLFGLDALQVFGSHVQGERQEGSGVFL